MNTIECGKCGYFDGIYCTKNNTERDDDEIVENCNNFEKSIYQ